MLNGRVDHKGGFMQDELREKIEEVLDEYANQAMEAITTNQGEWEDIEVFADKILALLPRGTRDRERIKEAYAIAFASPELNMENYLEKQ